MLPPSAPEITERALLSDDGDPQYLVTIGGAPLDWYTYANGYKAAGDLLVARLTSRGAFPEVCLPILFVYRHAVELLLKALLQDLGELNDTQEPTPDKHHLAPLWAKVESHVKRFGGHDWLDRARALVTELDQLDPSSLTFRYPVSKSGTPTVSGARSINMRHFRDVMAELWMILDGISGLVADNLSIKRYISGDQYRYYTY